MAAKKKPDKKAKKDDAVNDGPVILSWALDELPSSQHKVGLAGLVLLVQWMERRKPKSKGPAVCRVKSLSADGASFEFDKAGVEWLFDEAYAAAVVETSVAVQWPGAKPLRIVEEEVVDKKAVDKKTGKPKVKTQKRFIYEVVQPAGAFLTEVDPVGATGPWVKLWRDFIWSVLRAVPATRTPYSARAEKEETSDAADAWEALTSPKAGSTNLPSTYFVGAQQATAENVSFRDKERFQFLLHFWPFAVGLSVPAQLDRDGKTEFLGHVLSFADIIDLETFCLEYRHSLEARGTALWGYLPRDAVLDVPAEGGLQLVVALEQRLAAHESSKTTSDLVLGVDVFHLQREGNNVRTRSTARIEPSTKLTQEYVRVRTASKDPHFRRQRLLNLLAGRPWHAGFERLFATMPAEVFIRGRRDDGHFPSQFPFDVKREFEFQHPEKTHE